MRVVTCDLKRWDRELQVANWESRAAVGKRIGTWVLIVGSWEVRIGS